MKDLISVHTAGTTPDLYVATGFQKCGLAGAMLSAMVLSDLVRGKENPICIAFFPGKKSNPSGIVPKYRTIVSKEKLNYLLRF